LETIQIHIQWTSRVPAVDREQGTLADGGAAEARTRMAVFGHL
jgi:hypothetical protein